MGTAKRTKTFRDLKLESGFTSAQFILETQTSELGDKGILITGTFADRSGKTIENEEISSSYSNALQAKFQYIEEIKGIDRIFRSKPFYLGIPAFSAEFTAVEWGNGFSSDQAFHESLSGVWLVLRNSGRGTSWTYRVEP